ncbi:hypothetical protein SSX86_019496 [Deinandra increscens subsp. villosa]|uniref:DCD domain-containing protein n=1 Tax=Deinandra increscens subsp. villosa TaxID=3103831 RepID=A0AAP0GXB1_9ASTR
MGYKGNIVQGEIPESGAIFMSNTKTRKECLDRELFGLPSAMSNFVSHVKKGMTLFLFEFERRLLYGVFRATCDGEINIEPKAFRSSRKHFPAQVRFTTVWHCSPLAEHEFQDVIRDNYYSGKKFHFGLNEKQVSNLMKLFRSNIRSTNRPERNIRRYDDTPPQGNARSGDLRMDIKHRRYDDKPPEGNARSGDLRMEIKHRRYDDKPPEGNARSGDLRMEIKHRRYDDKSSEGNAISGDLRMDIRHRLRFDSCDLRGDEVQEVDDNLYINKHIIEARQKDEREGFLTHYTTESDKFGDCGRHDILGEHLDLKEKHIEDAYLPAFSNPHGKHLDQLGVVSNGFLMDDENKDIMDYNRLQDEYKVREGVRASLNERPLTDHVFSHFNQNAYSNCDSTRSDLPDIQLIPSCFDDGSSFISIANDCSFYPIPETIPISKSLPSYSHDEGSIRYHDDPGSQSSIFPKFVSRDMSSLDAALRVHEVDPTDDRRFCETNENKYYSHGEGLIRYHDDPGSQSSILPKFISRNISSSDAGRRVNEADPTDNDRRFREKNENKYYSQDEGSIRYHDDPASQSSIIPKFVSGDPTSSDAGIRVHEADPIDNDRRLCEKRKKKRTFGNTDKRANVFSRLTSTLRQEEHASETDEKHELNSSVDKVMKMLEKAVSSPITITGKNNSVKQDDDSNSGDSKIEDYEFQDVNLEVDADMAYEEIEGESVFQETRLVDFKRRKKSNKRSDDTSREGSECLIGATSDMGPVATDLLTGMPRKRRKLVRPAFVEKVLISNDVGAHENTISKKDSVSTKVVETSEKVDALVKSTDDVIMVPTSLENTPAFVQYVLFPDDVSAHENTVSENHSISTKVVKTSKKVDAFIASTDNVITLPTSLENTPAFVEKLPIPDDIGAHENTVSQNNSVSMEVVETSDKVVDAFVKSTDDIITLPTSLENKIPIPDDAGATVSENDSMSMEVVETTDKVVDASVKSMDDIITLPTSLENTPAFVEKISIPDVVGGHEDTVSENDVSMKVVETSDKVVDAFVNSTDDIIIMPTSLENTPAFDQKILIPDDVGAHENRVSENYSFSMKVVETSDEVVDAFAKSTDDIIMVPTSLESTPAFVQKILIPDDVGAHESTVSVDESVSMEGIETSEKVDAFVKSMDDIITMSTSLENTPDASNSTKSGIESSRKADPSIKFIDLNMLPTSDESSSSKDDNSMKASPESIHISTAECQETGNEGERNAENHLVSDVFVEGTPLKKNDNNQKMCGWIEW